MRGWPGTVCLPACGILCALLAPAGCVEPCPEKIADLDRLVAAYNANADAVPRLWARAKLSVAIEAEDAGAFTWRSGDPTCLLLLAKGPGRLGPCDFVLLGRESAAMELFRVGSSTSQGLYYFWYRFGSRAGAWVGRLDLAGAPGALRLPMDPTQLVSLLAVTPMPSDQTKLPAVALSMQDTPGECAYVVTLLDRQPVTGRVMFRRELLFHWTDAEPRRPYKVRLFDAAGRRVMTANLSNYRPIDVSSLDDPPAVSPLMPTDIEVVCHRTPAQKTYVERIRLVLSEMTAEDKWDRSACDFHPPAGVAPVRVDSPPTTAQTAPSRGGPAR